MKREKERGQVSFKEVQVTNLVKFFAESKLTLCSKELFEIEGKYFYYCYTACKGAPFNEKISIPTFSLRELSRAEFDARCAELLALKKGEKPTWEKDKTKYTLYVFSSSTWNKKIDIDACIFFSSSSILKEITIEAEKAIEQERKKVQEALEQKRKKVQEALEQKRIEVQIEKQIAFTLSRKTKVKIQNILQIGIDEKKVLEFKKSLSLAEDYLLSATTDVKVDFYNRLFQGTPEDRELALRSLSVRYFDADVSKLDLSDLKGKLENSFRPKICEYINTIAYRITALGGGEEQAKAWKNILNGDEFSISEIMQKFGLKPIKFPLTEFKSEAIRLCT